MTIIIQSLGNVLVQPGGPGLSLERRWTSQPRMTLFSEGLAWYWLLLPIGCQELFCELEKLLAFLCDELLSAHCGTFPSRSLQTCCRPATLIIQKQKQPTKSPLLHNQHCHPVRGKLRYIPHNLSAFQCVCRWKLEHYVGRKQCQFYQ